MPSSSGYLGTGGYVAVYVALVVFTLATVGASFLPLAGGWHIAVGLSIGLIKASLVALFFMHLTHSPRLIWSILAVALLWLAILVVLTGADYLTRDLIPGMPGH
jgi:cytochrome c oxidase subunit 4